jgi:hypothetical protein
LAGEWIRKAIAAALFGERPAIERITSGNVSYLSLVRQYFDAQRG